jgi:hypothetical protein
MLLRQAEPALQEARRLHRQRTATAHAHGANPPARSRWDEACPYAAASWAQAGRVILKAEGMTAGENPRLVVTSLEAPNPQLLYAALSCARGACATMIKAVQGDLHRGRTSETTFWANAMRVWLAGAASVLPQARRTPTLPHPARAHAQPSPLLLTLVTVAVLGKQYKDRLRLPLPRSCPVTGLLHRVTTLWSHVPLPGWHTSCLPDTAPSKPLLLLLPPPGRHTQRSSGETWRIKLPYRGIVRAGTGAVTVWLPEHLVCEGPSHAQGGSEVLAQRRASPQNDSDECV